MRYKFETLDFSLLEKFNISTSYWGNSIYELSPDVVADTLGKPAYVCEGMDTYVLRIYDSLDEKFIYAEFGNVKNGRWNIWTKNKYDSVRVLQALADLFI